MDMLLGADVHRNFKTIVMTTPSMLGFEDGDYESDTEKGVYHFIVGASSGLLKSAHFRACRRALSSRIKN